MCQLPVSNVLLIPSYRIAIIMGFKLQSVMALLKEKKAWHSAILQARFWNNVSELSLILWKHFCLVFVFSFSLSFLIFMCDYWLYQKLYVWLASLMNISVIICVHIKYCLYVVEWNFWLDLESMWEVLHCCMKNKRGVWQQFILHVFLCPPPDRRAGAYCFCPVCHTAIQ